MRGSVHLVIWCISVWPVISGALQWSVLDPPLFCILPWQHQCQSEAVYWYFHPLQQNSVTLTANTTRLQRDLDTRPGEVEEQVTLTSDRWAFLSPIAHRYIYILTTAPPPQKKKNLVSWIQLYHPPAALRRSWQRTKHIGVDLRWGLNTQQLIQGIGTHAHWSGLSLIHIWRCRRRR